MTYKVSISTPYNFSVKVPISTPYNFSVKVKQPPSFKTNFAFTLTEEVIPIMQ